MFNSTLPPLDDLMFPENSFSTVGGRYNDLTDGEVAALDRALADWRRTAKRWRARQARQSVEQPEYDHDLSMIDLLASIETRNAS